MTFRLRVPTKFHSWLITVFYLLAVAVYTVALSIQFLRGGVAESTIFAGVAITFAGVALGESLK